MSVGDRIASSLVLVIGFLPRLIAAIVVLLIGYIVAKLFQGATKGALNRLHLDARIRQSDAGRFISRISATPTSLLGRVVYWVFFLAFVALALSVLNIPPLTAFIGAIVGYLPNLLAALFILLAAGVISAMITAAINRTMGDTPTGRIARVAVPAVTITIAIFMALNQLKIAPDIVNITFTGLVGAMALGSALAFGLGGRDVARQLLQDAYDQGRTGVRQARTDLQRGRERASSQVAAAEEQIRQDVVPGRPSPAFGERIESSEDDTR